VSVDGVAPVDGNKRLGWTATAVFLALNGAHPTSTPNDDVYERVMRVAAGKVPLEEVAADLRRLADVSSP
jgi:death on curing protein